MSAQDWLEVEKQLEQKELELLKQHSGITLPEGHLDGYKYTPEPRVVDKESWDVKPVPLYTPECNSSNWKHADVMFELGEGIAYIVLNSPSTNNALSASMLRGIHDACFELHMRKDIRLVVLKAEGKMFCAGGDPKSFQEAIGISGEESKKSLIMLTKLLHFFQCLPQFTVGLAQGSAMGSGVGLLAACDVVCAVAAARFMVSEVKLGTCPAAIAPIIAAKIGAAHAKRILCTAENVTAALAKQIGLVTDIVDDELDFSKYVQTLCEKMTLCAPGACARSKALVQNVSRRPLTMKLLTYTGGQLADIRVGDEAVKGMIAVQARTKPYWAETPIKPLY